MSDHIHFAVTPYDAQMLIEALRHMRHRWDPEDMKWRSDALVAMLEDGLRTPSGVAKPLPDV